MLNKKISETNKKNEIIAWIAEKWFCFNALIAIFSIGAIAFFIFYQGVQPFFESNVFGKTSFWDFISQSEWRPGQGKYGIFYMIVGSIFATLGAIIVGVPIGVLTAVFIAEIAPAPIQKVIRSGVELLAGIPSVLFGIFGLGVIVPWIAGFSSFPQGESLLAVILVLAIMILPTVIAISESAIQAVPNSYREGSYGLGVSKIQTIFKVILPAAKSGILAGVVLGIGRAIGETMAVILVAGNPISGIPKGFFQPIRPLTTNIALEMSYAAELHQQMLFSTGVILFLFIMLINLVVNRLTMHKGQNK